MTNKQVLFDPIKYYNINENNYDKNFMDLFKHIINLINTSCIQIKEISHDIQKPPITYIKTTPISELEPEPVPEIDIDKINKLKIKLKELILYINDLIKMYVKLYNIIKLTEATVKHNVKEIRYILDNPNQDYTNKIPLDYSPISINEINNKFIDNIDIDNLIKIGNKLIDIKNIYKQKIGYWLKYSEKLHAYLDMHKITGDIFSQIVQKPELPELSKDKPQIGGDPPKVPKVEEVYDKLVEIKKIIDGITQLDVDFEIPYGTSLKWEDYKKNLLVLQNNLEKMTMDSEPKENPLKQNFTLNVFEKMPNYIKISDEFYSGVKPSLRSDIPEHEDRLNIQEILTNLEVKKKYYNDNLTKIKELNNDIVDFLKKIKAYKENEMTKYTKPEVEYPFTDIGLKTDIEKQIKDLEDDNKKQQEELQKSNEIKDILNQNIDYIKNRHTINKIDIDKYKTEIENLIRTITTYKPIGGQTENIISLELFEKYFKTLKETVKTKPKQTQTESKPNYQLPKKKTQGEPKKEIKKEPEIQETIMPNYEEGLFLKFDSSQQDKQDNIFRLLEERNFIEVNKLLTTLKKTLNYISDNNIDENLIRPTNLFKTEPNLNYPYIFNIIKKTSTGAKSQNLNNINSNFEKGKNLSELEKIIKQIEELNETPELLKRYILLKEYKSESENINFDNLEQEKEKFNTKVSDIEKKIELNNNNITTQQTAKQNISEDDLKLSNAFNLTANYEAIIKELEGYISRLNSKLKELTLLNESSNLKENIPDWTPILQKGGTIYEENLQNLNRLSELNEMTRELLIILETYKSNSTDLINKYNEFVREAYSILVYLRYKLLAFNDIKNNAKIDFKFNKSILEELKNKISSKNRKNFDFIKKLYINIITDIIDKLTKEQKKFIDFKNYINREALINIIILVHLNINIDKY